jgi:hypothetical protein
MIRLMSEPALYPGGSKQKHNLLLRLPFVLPLKTDCAFDYPVSETLDREPRIGWMDRTWITTFGGAMTSYGSESAMCFLPYRRASTDQVPGPIIANVDPRTANATGMPAVSGANRAIHASMPATRTPATGVHNPAISRRPASAPRLWWMASRHTGVAVRQAKSQ